MFREEIHVKWNIDPFVSIVDMIGFVAMATFTGYSQCVLGKFRVATAIHSAFLTWFLMHWFSFIALSAWWQSNTDYDAFTA